MIRIEIEQGDRLEVGFRDADATILVSYNWQDNRKAQIEVDMPDSSGREGVIYCEDFSEEMTCKKLKEDGIQEDVQPSGWAFGMPEDLE